jgi:hypothetical protein
LTTQCFQGFFNICARVKNGLGENMGKIDINLSGYLSGKNEKT